MSFNQVEVGGWGVQGHLGKMLMLGPEGNGCPLVFFLIQVSIFVFFRCMVTCSRIGVRITTKLHFFGMI
jgi:hypothetical protein